MNPRFRRRKTLLYLLKGGSWGIPILSIYRFLSYLWYACASMLVSVSFVFWGVEEEGEALVCLCECHLCYGSIMYRCLGGGGGSVCLCQFRLCFGSILY